MTKTHGIDPFGEPLEPPPAWATRAPLPDPGAIVVATLAYVAGAILGAVGLPLLIVAIYAALPNPPGGDDGSPFFWVIALPVLAAFGSLAGVIAVLWGHILLAVTQRCRRTLEKPLALGEVGR